MADYVHRIYKLSDERGMVYYGCTRQPDLRNHLNQHRYQAKQEMSTSHLLFQPTEDGQPSLVCIDEVERLPAGTSQADARARERWWIENHECVNKNMPGRGQVESYRNYQRTHRSKCREACRRWREKNPNYSKEWALKHPNYYKDYYRAKKEKMQADMESDSKELKLIYDASSWYNNLCDKGAFISLK